MNNTHIPKTELEKKILISALSETGTHKDWTLNQIIIEEIEKLQKKVDQLKERVKQLTYHDNPLQFLTDTLHDGIKKNTES